MSPKDATSKASSLQLKSESTISSTSTHHELTATAFMCYHCFDVLLNEFRGNQNNGLFTKQANKSWSKNRPTFDSITPKFVHHLPQGVPVSTLECPLFVTWEIRKQHHRLPTSSFIKNHNDSELGYELRGCIGTLSPKPLVSSIGEYALLSALRDKRFRPITLPELPNMRVSVSLLVQYEVCENCYDWTVGVHGIIIRWNMDHPDRTDWSGSREREFSATYLPEVALEQRWDQQTSVESLIRKAGYYGRITESLLQQIRCTRYQSSKCQVTFDDYLKAQKQLNSNDGDGTFSPDILRGWTVSGNNDGVHENSALSNCVVS